MIDLHTHTFFSDGELVASELVQRAYAAGYTAIALTDHTDSSNIEFIVGNISRAADDLNRHCNIKVIPGVELTHVPPAMIGTLTSLARSLGARLVVVHGETIVEPVKEGTNRAAIEAGVDILAHPGLISDEDCRLARDCGVTLEITARKGHSLTNGHVAMKASQFGVPLVINTDTHSPHDLITKDMAVKVLLGAGIPHGKVGDIFQQSQYLANKLCKNL
ncbi:histidinol phosphate phosphatase domain-containing protein [Candidatus Magnetominusculus dajiuhuensis]|uniref:histidinol phosphate phosphatase domain-containing protein n=1 Tax=Candidatus Magnetominusculus dajiuhuensis TaxID=3137712 RepID=UPI003B4350C3